MSSYLLFEATSQQVECEHLKNAAFLTGNQRYPFLLAPVCFHVRSAMILVLEDLTCSNDIHFIILANDIAYVYLESHDVAVGHIHQPYNGAKIDRRTSAST